MGFLAVPVDFIIYGVTPLQAKVLRCGCLRRLSRAIIDSKINGDSKEGERGEHTVRDCVDSSGGVIGVSVALSLVQLRMVG
jgi:hypothetical protein